MAPRTITLYAEEILSGDCDVYGKGSWRADFRMKIQGDRLILEGKITFSENYGDHTKLSGKFTQDYALSEIIDKYSSSMRISISQHSGSVSGRIGPDVHMHRYNGSGFIQSAEIISDTAGCDDGKVGGEITFEEIIITVK